MLLGYTFGLSVYLFQIYNRKFSTSLSDVYLCEVHTENRTQRRQQSVNVKVQARSACTYASFLPERPTEPAENV